MSTAGFFQKQSWLAAPLTPGVPFSRAPLVNFGILPPVMVQARSKFDCRWLSVSDVASCLAVAPDKVLAWIHSGELRGHDLTERSSAQRPRWRISPDDLEAFLRARQTRPAPIKSRPQKKLDTAVIEYY